jgi:DNA-binding NarL/FixJ family response regulator
MVQRLSAMETSHGSRPTDQYLRLVAEYQLNLAHCIAGLERLRETQRELRKILAPHPANGEPFDAASRIEQSLRQVVGTQVPAPEVNMEDLSTREQEVFRLLGQGYSTPEIAEELNLAISTVETYRERLKSKLNLSNGIALTRCAILWAISCPEANQDLSNR